MKTVRWIGLAILIVFSGLSVGLSSVLLARVEGLEADLATERENLSALADEQQASSVLVARVGDLEDDLAAERQRRELDFEQMGDFVTEMVRPVTPNPDCTLLLNDRELAGSLGFLKGELGSLKDALFRAGFIDRGAGLGFSFGTPVSTPRGC